MAGTGLDWPGLMRLGLREMRLKPWEFWALTPAELALMSGRDPATRGGPMTRSALDALARLYPDQERNGDGR
ncbi:MAG: rcc01693 family protein [Pseudomonadota bacterium]